MPVKAIYASGTLAVYVTGPDILALLNAEPVLAPIRVGTADMPGSAVALLLNDQALEDMPAVVSLERRTYGNSRLRKGDKGWQFAPIRERRKDG